ncbi:MAG: DUF3793 family protein [Lachnospiraceae bacterium]|nr:DUF3793 family protein [Lachnospiraceae bacterium]
MCREVLEMVQGMDPKCVEWQLSMQCAPLITGCKLSNLLMLPVHCREAVEKLLQGSDIAWFVLRETGHKITMLLYHRENLEAYLRREDVAAILREEGYPAKPQNAEKNEAAGMEEILGFMRRRYEDSRDGKGAFPHEMGLFLGYPVDDVRGFMQKQGREFLYSGYWKVYDRVEEKKKIFESYETAQDTIIRLVHEGISLREILMLYEDSRREFAGAC